MKHTLLLAAAIFIFLLPATAQQPNTRKNNISEREYRKKEHLEKKYFREHEENEHEENDEYDGPDQAALFEFKKTKDPSLGRVPKDRLLMAIERARRSRQERPTTSTNLSAAATTSLTWTERGPYADAVGPSNGNTRANSGITAGRVRAIMVDSGDQTHKTVWVAGVDGGIWKTTDITVSPANWTPINDFLNNLAVTDICQDPTNANTMYFCTGEAYYNGDAVQGLGVFKSTDHGATWTQLSSTSNYKYCTRILCDYQGYVYLATRGSGLLRSKDNGSTWTNITPTGLVSDICDLEISSTATAGRLHMVTGIFSQQAYRYTDIPGTVTSSSGWTAPVTAFPSYNMRAEITCMGNTLYALPANGSYQVPTIYKSTNGGANWTATTGQPTSGWASGQGWYALAASINPGNTNECIVGGLDTWKTTDGGATWTAISAWVGTAGQYVHADVHKILWYDNGAKLLFGCDGGIHFSTDGGATIRDRNSGLRIKQFYSCAIHPTSTDYMLAGAQDNGTHQLNAAGLASSVEVLGGDGAFVAIDATNPQFQFGAYVYGYFRRSTNSGSGWSSVNFFEGSSSGNQMGQFINAYVLDDSTETIYAGAGGNEFFRWTTATTTAAGSYYSTGTPAFPTGASLVTGITAFGGGQASALKVSPYTLNRVFFGTTAGRVVRIDSAYTAATTNPTAINITGGSMPAGYVSNIEVGTNDSNLIVSFANYGVSNVWVSSDAGTSWTVIDGNLPDMPVRWAMFYPGDNARAIIATEAGVWTTDLINGSSTVWTASSSFPVVRTDMLKYRSADQTLVAATHGRGLWTTTLPQLVCTPAASNIVASNNTICAGSGTTLSLSQAYGTTSYTFQWMSASTSGGTYANLSTSSTQATGNLNATMYYKCMITCITTSASFTTPEFALTVSTVPSAPSGTGSERCGTGTVTLTATPPSGATVAWYSAVTGGSALATTNSYTTTSISTSTTYYAESQIGSTCVSTSRTAFVATINTVPSAPTAGVAGSRCGTGTVVINAITSGGVTADWYAASTGGTVLSGGSGVNSFTTPSISATTNYYAQARNSTTGCISASRLTVAATVNAVPGAATSPLGASRCGTGSVTLSATAATGTTIDWYDASTSGTRVQAGTVTGVNNYTTTLSATTTFYAETRNLTTGCVASSRVAATATINTPPSAPTGSGNARCGTGTVMLTATPPSGATIAWFSVATGGTALATTNSYTTPSISASTTYYAESRIGTTCVSATRTSFVATINAQPATPTAGTAGSRCGPGTVVINANTPSGITVDWYAASTGGTVLANGLGTNSFTTPSITATTNYYAQAKNSTTTCTSASRLTVAATINAIPAAPSSIGVTGGTSTSGTLTSCPVLNTNYSYTAAAVNGVKSYLWTIPVCATPSTNPISTTNKLTAKFSGAGTTDSMKVQTRSSAGCLSVVRGVKVTNATTCAACTAPLAGSQNLTVVAPANPVSDLEGAVNVKVYPNPTLGVFNVQVRSADKGGVLIKVLDMQGRLLKEIRTTPYKTNRVGADLRPGLYFLEVSQGKYKSSVKVIKE